MMSDEVFECYAVAEGTSGAKFWEVRVDGSDMHIRYGKVGQDKSWTTKSFSDHAAALKEAKKKLRSKTNKGYVEASRDGDAGAPPAAAQTYEEKWGELRSLVEQKANKSNLNKVKALFESMWTEDKERTDQELVPFLTDKLESWPDGYFAHSVKREGNRKPWPKATAPLFDDEKLDDAPFAIFARGFSLDFNGCYEPGDDVEVSDYAQKYWVDQPVNTRTFCATRASKSLKKIKLSYHSLCEIQQYVTPAHSDDLKRLLAELPNIEEITLHNSWAMQHAGPIFANKENIAKLRTLDLLKSPITLKDINAIANSPKSSTLTRLAFTLSNDSGRDQKKRDAALVKLFSSTHLSNLEELAFTQGGDCSFGEDAAKGLLEATFKDSLTTFRHPDHITNEALSILISDELGLKTLDLWYSLRPEHLDTLEGSPAKCKLKTLVVNSGWQWNDEQNARLDAWGASRKVKIKRLSSWDQVVDY